MTMQYDVRSSNLNESGFFFLNGTPNRSRLKQLSYAPNGSNAGTLFLFDTLVAPTTGTYQRSGTTVTVTVSGGHGLTSGTTVGIGYAANSGVAATDGNYIITVTGTTTFTITDPNSGSTGSPAACYYVVAYPSGDSRYQYPQRWLTSFDTNAGQTSSQQILIPGEGMLINNGLYGTMSYIPNVTIFYG